MFDILWYLCHLGRSWHLSLTWKPVGDDRGPRGFIMNLLHGRVDENRHISLPMPAKTLIPAENEYLERREALSLPPNKIQDALIRCYFHYVHPFAPILDGDDFLCRYRAGKMSLLLLWSVFTAAGNVSRWLHYFPSPSTLTQLVYRWKNTVWWVWSFENGI